MQTPITDLVPDTTYVGLTTGTLRGERHYSEFHFQVKRPQAIEPFVPASPDRPAQDRVFIADRVFGTSPALFVAGSIREA